jgi:FkbM family methyltransferase
MAMPELPHPGVEHNTMLRKLKGAIRKFIARLLSSCGYVLAKAKPPDTLDLLGMAIDQVFPLPEKPLVVQVGACDGVAGDPICTHIRRRGFPAILVEPIPESVRRLCRNYADVLNVEIVQAAISDSDSKITMYRVREDRSVKGSAEGGDWTPQIASFNKRHLLDHGILEGDIEEVTVPGMTLRSLLSEKGVVQVGILQVDAEGFDDRVVAMAVMLENPPTIIHFEHDHLSSDRLLAIIGKLRECGYQWVTLKHDVLAIKAATHPRTGMSDV